MKNRLCHVKEQRFWCHADLPSPFLPDAVLQHGALLGEEVSLLATLPRGVVFLGWFVLLWERLLFHSGWGGIGLVFLPA